MYIIRFHFVFAAVFAVVVAFTCVDVPVVALFLLGCVISCLSLHSTLKKKHTRRSREDIERKMSDFGFALGYIAGASAPAPTTVCTENHREALLGHISTVSFRTHALPRPLTANRLPPARCVYAQRGGQ